MSDQIFLVFYMSLPGIRNMQRHLSYLSKMGFGRDRVKLIANRVVKKSAIKKEDAEKVLNYPIFWSIPNDYETTMSCLNKGVPISVGAPKSHLHASLKDLAKAVIKSR
jgi:pilus assembly protein CpaE